MKVKKYYGVDNHDVMAKVKTELGSDAVILHQRIVKPKGFLGFLKKPIIEVVAAIEEVDIPLAPIPVPKQKTYVPNFAQNQENELRQKVASNLKDKELENEIKDIKSMLGTVVNQMQNINSPKSSDKTPSYKNSYLYSLLSENELDEELISVLLKDFNEDIDSFEKEDKQYIKNQLTEILASNSYNTELDFSSKVVFFVGPTGVGKTTTIAKLAANYKLEKGRSVGFISADTYRIAAVEQLKVYSDILNIPLEVVYSPNDINAALERLSDKDIIMVDTAGRSHKNNKQVDELALLLDKVHSKTVYLVISSTTKYSDLKDILNTYGFLKNYKIIFTKLDEVSTYGPILNIAIREPDIVSYITTGQSVPDDIETITSDKILDMLLKEIQYD